MKGIGGRKRQRFREPWEKFSLKDLRDRGHFDLFVHCAYQPLLEFAYQLLRNWDDAGDVVQSVLIDLWEKLTQQKVRELSANALAFVRQQTKWRAIDFMRKRQPLLTDETPNPSFEEEGANGGNEDEWQKEDEKVERIVIALEKRRALYRCGEELTGRAKEVFLLLTQGVSQAEIAQRLGISPSRVSSLVKMVCHQLRQRLQTMGWECCETIGVPLNF